MGKCHDHRRSHKCHNKRKCHKSCRDDCKNRIHCRHGDENWLQFGKTLGNTRNANCEKKINRHNVSQLVQKWAFLPFEEYGFTTFDYLGLSIEGKYGYGGSLNNNPGGPGLAFKLNLTDGSPVWAVGDARGDDNVTPEYDDGIRNQPAVGEELVYYALRGRNSGRPKIVALHKDTGLFAWQSFLDEIPGLSSAPGEFFNYKFQAGVVPPPAVGYLQLNNADLTLSTQMYINCIDQDVVDACPFLDTLVPGAIIILYKGDDYVSYFIDNITPAGAYYELDLTYRSGTPPDLALNQDDDLKVLMAPPTNFPLTTIPTSPIIYVKEDNLLIQALVALGDNFGTVQAFDATTGAKLWYFKTTKGSMPGINEGGPGVTIFGPGAVDTARKLVFYGTGQNFTTPASDLQDSVIALNYLTGDFVWKHQFNTTDITSIPPIKNWDVSGGPHLDSLCIHGKKRDVVLGGGKQGNFYVIDRESGDLINNYTIIPPAPSGSSNQGFNYAGCTDGKYWYFCIMYSEDDTPIGPVGPPTKTALVKINPKNGQVVGRTEFDGGLVMAPVFANGVVYFNTLLNIGAGFPQVLDQTGGTFYAVDACTGEVVKEIFTPGYLRAGATVVSNGVVYTTLTQFIFGIDASIEQGIYAYHLSDGGCSKSKSKSKSKAASKSKAVSLENIDLAALAEKFNQ